MLDQVELDIEKLKNDTTSFDHIYSTYIMKIQDEIIDQEISYMLRTNNVSIDMLDRAILKSYQEMIREW